MGYDKILPCDFDEFGNCATIRNKHNRHLGAKEDGKRYHYIHPGVGCCGMCAIRKGYLFEKWDEKIYGKYFMPVVGFWRIGGCILPRKLRSVTCIGFKCYKR